MRGSQQPFYVLIDMNFLMYWHNTCKLSGKQENTLYTRHP